MKKSKPQYRIPKSIDRKLTKLVELGVISTKQSFVSMAVGKFSIEFGLISLDDLREKEVAHDQP